jgi:hypothetical protein
MNIYDHVKSLNESGLYDDLKTVVSSIILLFWTDYFSF